MSKFTKNLEVHKLQFLFFIVLIINANIIFASSYSPRSLYGSIPGGDLQSVWNNPAMIGQLETGEKGGLYLELHNDFRYDPNLSIGGNFNIGKNLTLGFAAIAQHYHVLSEPLIAQATHYTMASALSLHKYVDMSLGILGTYTDAINEIGESCDNQHMDVGINLEWPVLQTFDRGNFNLFHHKFQADIIPGIEYSFHNIFSDITSNFIFYSKIIFYDNTLNRNALTVSYSFDNILGGVQVDIYNLLSMRSGRLYSFDVNRIGFNITQLTYDVLSAFKIPNEKLSILNRFELKCSYGVVDPNYGYITFLPAPELDYSSIYNLSVSWKF